jgi:filamentous hemagglutinin family protein
MSCKFLYLGLVVGLIGAIAPANAQSVISDGTLNTIVTRSGNVFTIDNGTTSGTNLFHSFREFSIPTGGSAIFNNAATVQNIFSRVTGGTASNIDGLIQAQGSANLFLLNPSGILFGANASLNIGGSFVGTTAQSIQFADGIELSASNPNDRPLLTMSAPIGLQMGQNPAAIAVQNTGHTLGTVLPRSIPLPTQRDPQNTGLTLTSGKTLALIRIRVLP